MPSDSYGTVDLGIRRKPVVCCANCAEAIHLDELWGWVHLYTGEPFCQTTVAEPKAVHANAD